MLYIIIVSNRFWAAAHKNQLKMYLLSIIVSVSFPAV